MSAQPTGMQAWLPAADAPPPLFLCCPRCWSETGKRVPAIDEYARSGGCRECDKRDDEPIPTALERLKAMGGMRG